MHSSILATPSSAPATVLVVDDDAVMRQRLHAYFSKEGYRVLAAEDGSGMWSILASSPVALILLDINLPGQDGISLAREIRARNAGIGIILVTSRTEDIDKIVGLEVGADDYVTKPFNPRLLLARAKTLLRRTMAAQAPGSIGDRRLSFAGFVLDTEQRRLFNTQGREMPLTRGEFSLLRTLVQHPGAVLDRDRLCHAIGGKDWSPADRTVDVLIRRLRAKLDTDTLPSLITTVRGEGYRLAAEVTAADNHANAAGTA